jgi:hypothetical protein
MTFQTTLVSAQEAHQIASSEPGDFHIRVLLIAGINTAVDADTFTATVSVAGVETGLRERLCRELNTLGYAVDSTTTPNSFIITW